MHPHCHAETKAADFAGNGHPGQQQAVITLLTDDVM